MKCMFKFRVCYWQLEKWNIGKYYQLPEIQESVIEFMNLYNFNMTTYLTEILSLLCSWRNKLYNNDNSFLFSFRRKDFFLYFFLKCTRISLTFMFHSSFTTITRKLNFYYIPLLIFQYKIIPFIKLKIHIQRENIT